MLRWNRSLALMADAFTISDSSRSGSTGLSEDIFEIVQIKLSVKLTFIFELNILLLPEQIEW